MVRYTYKNPSENKFAEWARQQGFQITKRGWPDFFCWDDNGKFALVEVKRNPNTTLKKCQSHIMTYLSKYNVPCYKWTPNLILTKIENGTQTSIAHRLDDTYNESVMCPFCSKKFKITDAYR